MRSRAKPRTRKAIRGLGTPEKRSKPAGEVSEATREIVLARAGYRCERCGRSLYGVRYSIHHRHPRGMGGSRLPWLHLPSNLIALCGSGTTDCHGEIESDREQAIRDGYLVLTGIVPFVISVKLYGGSYFWLLDDGSRVLDPRYPIGDRSASVASAPTPG